ncbi:MAG: hypothetical protein IT356_00540 [Gemmatimonadaceae bacterium]|nr:hypothetical protein [Gemmatimonadaceae bacterium]
MPDERYRHTQRGWTIIAASAGLATAGVFASLVGGRSPAVYVLVPVAAIMALLMGTLTVAVDDSHVRIRFGIGLIRRSIELSTIGSAAVTRVPWWVGTGVRRIEGGWLYNVAGRRAVDLRLDGGVRVAIGTDEPSALATAIAEAAGIEPVHTGEVDARSFAWPAIVIALLVACLGVLVYMQTQPSRVDLSRERVSITSMFYRTVIPTSEITEVVVTDSAPAIEARLNGFALGKTRRGRFRVSGLGEGSLFVEMDSPPFVVIHAKGSFAMLSYRNYEHTSKLIEGLAKVAAR